MLNDPTSDEHANDVMSLVYKEQVATSDSDLMKTLDRSVERSGGEFDWALYSFKHNQSRE